MKTGFVPRDQWAGAPDVLVRSETGEKLHIAPCPHVNGGIRAADDREKELIRMCSWCEKEVGGYGRTYFTAIEDAMKAFKTYSGTENLIKDVVKDVVWDQIWIPNSASYVALGFNGQGVAWFGKTWAMATKDGPYIELPGNRAGSGGGAKKPDRLGEVCELHNVTRSVSGVCWMCDE